MSVCVTGVYVWVFVCEPCDERDIFPVSPCAVAVVTARCLVVAGGVCGERGERPHRHGVESGSGAAPRRYRYVSVKGGVTSRAGSRQGRGHVKGGVTDYVRVKRGISPGT